MADFCPKLPLSLFRSILPPLNLASPLLSVFPAPSPHKSDDGFEWRVEGILLTVADSDATFPHRPVFEMLLPAADPPLDAAMMRTDFSAF